MTLDLLLHGLNGRRRCVYAQRLQEHVVGLFPFQKFQAIEDLTMRRSMRSFSRRSIGGC